MNFNSLLMRTAFSCMACDGQISQDEINLVNQISNEILPESDSKQEINNLVNELKTKGLKFLRNYINELSSSSLSEKEGLKVLNVAYKTIVSDKVIEYSEVKFFKLIRYNLGNISDDVILKYIPGIDENFLAEDIKDSYSVLFNSYFSKEEDSNFNFDNIKL